MAYQLFRVGKTWHYRFQINGARVQRTTREMVKHKADAIAEKEYNRAKLWARGEEPVPTLRELVTLWQEVHEPIVSSGHAKVVSTFGRLHLFDLAEVELDLITTELVEVARLEYLKTHAPASANQWLNVLKLLFRWAVRRKMIPALPWVVKPLKLQKKPRETLPVSMTRAWIDQIDLLDGENGATAMAVRLMLGIGLREAETITAQWEWIDWDRKTYTPGITKGREADPLPLPDWLLDYLRQRRRPDGLIVVHANGRPYRAGFTRNTMLAANKALGVGHITAHRLRGTFATLLSEAGAPVQMVQRALRHKSINTTMAYLEVNMELVARAQARIAQDSGLDSPAHSEVGGDKSAHRASESGAA